MDWKGATALVTGASGGIGEAFARELAARGASVVLVARRKDRLEALARELKRAHGVKAVAFSQDLTAAGAADALFKAAQKKKLRIDLLVNNAGFGLGGDFAEQPPARVTEMLELNVVTLAALTRLFLPGMLERGRGGVVNVASTAAFQPLPYFAAYAASKAFVLSFSEALWEECRGRGVTVMALCPGATVTEFWSVAGLEALPGSQTPEQVVATALQGLDDGKSHVISGWMNYALAHVSRAVPREVVTRIAGRIFRPKA